MRILTLYSDNTLGWERTALLVNDEGWAFGDRSGQPRCLNKDDIRRVISNWREYAGLVPGGKAKNKISARLDDPLAELVATGRNVIDMGLLRDVAEAQAARSYKKTRLGHKHDIHKYALSGILYCAHCAQDAKDRQNIRLNATLTGQRNRRKRLRYRHKSGHPCRAQQHSILRDEIEADFVRLIGLLTVDESKLSYIEELRAISRLADLSDPDAPDPLQEKQIAIAKCQKRIENARILCMAGEMSPEDYFRIKDNNEREIAHWNARTADVEKKPLSLPSVLRL